MFDLFKSKQVQVDVKPILQKMAEATFKDFYDIEFYQWLKINLTYAKHWQNSEKQQFVELTLKAFEQFTGGWNWQTLSAKHPSNIYRLSKGSQVPLDCLTLIAKSFPVIDKTEDVRYILEEVERIKAVQKNKIYFLPPTSMDYKVGHTEKGFVFKDEGLHIALVYQLMFIDDLLKPKFDINVFNEEYEFYQSYYEEPNFQAGDYLRHLPIPQHLLNGVTELYLDCEAPLYKQIFVRTPYNGFMQMTSFPTGDYLPLKEKAVEELSYLPNLKRIGISWDSKKEIRFNFPPILFDTLKAKGIEIFYRKSPYEKEK